MAMLLVGVLAASVAACSGGDSPTEVIFAAGDFSVAARPTQLCDVSVQNCTADPAAAVVLRVPPGQALRISVPDPVAATPWLVVFRYRTAAGERAQARSQLFGAGAQHEYTLTTPAPQDQLETVEVQQIGGALAPGDEGVDFVSRATWVLSVDDR
jgi:hypothetical protein